MSKVSVLAKLRTLLAREAPEQAATIREAIAQSARTGNEASVVGPANLPRRSKITIGRPDTVQPNVSDRTAALDYAQPGQGIIDFHTHPYGSDDSMFLVRPSSTDLGYFNANYKPGDFQDRELRTLIVQPPSLRDRMPAAYSMFATDKPAVLAPRLLDTARNELGMAARKGRFKSIMDDPTFRDYFDYGGELSDLVADAAPLLMLRHRAAQGVGRHEYGLSGRTLTPNPESTETNLLQRMEPAALEVLREKKYAKGGEVTASRSAAMADDLNRPYIGYRSAGRRPESQQDRRASADAPLAALRGMVSGVLGAPGDIESLVRMLPGLNEQTVLPTSEDVEKRLPMRSVSQTPVGQAFTTAGQLGGGFYTGPGSPLRAIAALPSAVSRAGRDFVMAAGQPAVNVVKPKGGNWLAGTVERTIDPMRTLDPNMVNTLRNADPRFVDQAALSRMESEGGALDRWLETKLAKYIKNEMATPEDPIRALAERGIIHSEITPTGYSLMVPRLSGGFPEEGMGVSPLAKAWEGRADSFVNKLMASDLTSQYPKMVEENPWLLKVPPETRVYDMLRGADEDLGFSHLVDELKNAINPASGLPENLRWKYSDLDKVSVPQAVERVAKINEWRAAQKAEADMARAMNPATQVVKEYPEQGFKWVELRQPKETGRKISVEKSEMDLPPDMDQRQMREVAEDMAFDEGFDEGTPEFNNFVRDMMTDFNRKKKVEMDESYKALEDALKYEGETMGHCVGGYCPDVVEGRSKIYSLRDKKGQPHVTIEVAPRPLKTWDDVTAAVGKDEAAKLWQEFDDIGGNNMSDVGEGFDIFIKNKGIQPAQDIVQIKGKANRAPKEEYLPAVQDFVRSGNFGKVGDLQNTGLIDIQDPNAVLRALGKVSPERNIQQAIDNFNAAVDSAPNAQRYMSLDEMRDFLGGPSPEGFASGGLVSGVNFHTDDFDPARIGSIVDELHAMNAG
jgi:hypothetical protein